jgi:hypothetical protein
MRENTIEYQIASRRRRGLLSNATARCSGWRIGMSEFLVGDELSARIRAIIDRGNPRLAIAFWGRGAAADLFEDEQAMRRAKIICDVSMGGTHHEALINLGAPGNARLKHIPGLHAKVCLSKEGVVVGSANASNKGIGFAGRSAKNFEAGAFYSSGSDAWATASKWFNARFRIASQVDDAAVGWARKSWRPPRLASFRNLIRSLMQSVSRPITTVISQSFSRRCR